MMSSPDARLQVAREYAKIVRESQKIVVHAQALYEGLYGSEVAEIRRAYGSRRVRASATDPPFLRSCSLRVLDYSPVVQLGHL